MRNKNVNQDGNIECKRGEEIIDNKREMLFHTLIEYVYTPTDR